MSAAGWVVSQYTMKVGVNVRAYLNAYTETFFAWSLWDAATSRDNSIARGYADSLDEAKAAAEKALADHQKATTTRGLDEAAGEALLLAEIRENAGKRYPGDGHDVHFDCLGPDGEPK